MSDVSVEDVSPRRPEVAERAQVEVDGTVPSTSDGMAGGLSAVQEEMALLRKSFDQHQERAAARERVIDHLNAELDRLRTGDRRSLLRPVLLELCRLRDDLVKQASSLPDTFTVAQAQVLLESYADTVELALEAQAVVPFDPQPDDRFDSRKHRRVTVQTTAEGHRHGTVASVERSGYLDQETDRVLQSAGVVLYEYAAPPQPDAAPETTHTPDAPSPTEPPTQATDTTTEEQP